MPKVLSRCPVCDSALGVTELACAHCHTSIHGDFATCRFCRLSSEHLGFVETFLRNEGNLSRVGAALGLSYPTVRNKLEAALTALGLDRPEPTGDPVAPFSPQGGESDRVKSDGKQVVTGIIVGPEVLQQRRLVLQHLSDGTLSAEEAADALRDL